MIRRPPRSTRTDTLFPYTTLFRSAENRPQACRLVFQGAAGVGRVPHPYHADRGARPGAPYDPRLLCTAARQDGRLMRNAERTANAPPPAGADLPAIDTTQVLGALPTPILLVGDQGEIYYANPAAEQFFDSGAAFLYRQNLRDLVPFGSPVLQLIAQVFRERYTVSEYDVDLGSPRLGERLVDVQVSPVPEQTDRAVVRFDERTVAAKIDRALTYRGRSEEHTSELQSLMRISYAVFCLKKKTKR